MDNLIIQTAYLGDLVLAIPLMRQLAMMDPEHGLSVVCRQGLGPALSGLKFIHRVIEVNKRDRELWRRQRAGLLGETFHNVICPHESPRTAWLVGRLRASGLKIGFRKPWNFWAFDQRVEKPLHLPDALRQLSLLTALDSAFAEEFSSVASREDLWNSERLNGLVDFRQSLLPGWAKLGVEHSTRAGSKRVFLAPGSVWATKRWTVEGYTDLARQLVSEGYEVTLVGSPEERELTETIRQSVPRVLNFTGQWSVADTIREFASGLALVANDSGAIHLAALAGLPTVAIFGPTTLALGFRPWQEQALVVQRELNCRPCGRHGHDNCPIGTHECMKSIRVADVYSAFRGLVERPQVNSEASPTNR